MDRFLRLHPLQSLPQAVNPTLQDDSTWEDLWSPYDQPTYQAVLSYLRPADIVIDIGAGDLRLSRQMAASVQQVFAVERREEVLRLLSLADYLGLPSNLVVIVADARWLSFPPDITTGVLLMRHCTHFRLYAEKLLDCGCSRLITNARWRMGVEMVDLQAPRQDFSAVEMGWYACWCGAVGFKPGPPERLNPETEAIIHEVSACPRCSSSTPLC